MSENTNGHEHKTQKHNKQHNTLAFLVLSGSELAPSVLIADFPGWGWGRE